MVKIPMHHKSCKGGWGVITFHEHQSSSLAFDRQVLSPHNISTNLYGHVVWLVMLAYYHLHDTASSINLSHISLVHRLQYLFMRRPAIPFPTPLLVHEPRRSRYKWGGEALTFGYLTKVSTGHFMQPNSLDFVLALHWRTLEVQLAQAKEALLHKQQMELVEVIKAYYEVCIFSDVHCDMFNTEVNGCQCCQVCVALSAPCEYHHHNHATRLIRVCCVHCMYT